MDLGTGRKRDMRLFRTTVGRMRIVAWRQAFDKTRVVRCAGSRQAAPGEGRIKTTDGGMPEGWALCVHGRDGQGHLLPGIEGRLLDER